MTIDNSIRVIDEGVDEQGTPGILRSLRVIISFLGIILLVLAVVQYVINS